MNPKNDAVPLEALRVRTLKAVEKCEDLRSVIEEFFKSPSQPPLDKLFGRAIQKKYAKYRDAVCQFAIDLIGLSELPLALEALELCQRHHLLTRPFAYELAKKVLTPAYPGLRSECLLTLESSLPATDKTLIPLIAKFLDDPDAGVRGAALTALGHFKATACIEKMVDLIADPDDFVRSMALSGIVDMDEWGKKHVMPFVPKMARFLRDSHAGVRETAANAMMKYAKMMPELTRMLEDPDKHIRLRGLHLVEYCLQNHTFNLPEMLAGVLKDADKEVKQQAEKIVSQHGN